MIGQVLRMEAIPLKEEPRSFGVFKAEVRDSTSLPLVVDPTKINKITCGSFLTLMESPDPSLTVSMDVCLLGLILVSFGAVPMVVNQGLQLQLGDNLKNLLSQQDTKDELIKRIFTVDDEELAKWNEKIESIREVFVKKGQKKASLEVNTTADEIGVVDKVHSGDEENKDENIIPDEKSNDASNELNKS